VRVREDRVQLSADEARPYEPEAEKTEEEATIKEEEVAPPPAEAKPAVVKVQREEKSAQNRRLVISLSQTSDAEGDKASLYKIIDILRRYPGHDEVKLRITNGNKIVHLRFFDIYAGYCSELHGRLASVVGEEGLKLEKR
jgi:hypothetical protein